VQGAGVLTAKAQCIGGLRPSETGSAVAALSISVLPLNNQP